MTTSHPSASAAGVGKAFAPASTSGLVLEAFRFQTPTSCPSAIKRWAIDDGQLTANALTTGDLNGDKRTDLVLLGDNNIYFLPQLPDHSLGEVRLRRM